MRGSRGQKLNGLQQVISDHGHHDVQFEVRTQRIGPGNRSIVPNHLCRRHHHGLWNDRVHLARHDGTARLKLRNLDLPQAAARPRGQPANVVGDVGKAHRNRTQMTRRFNCGVFVRHRFKRIISGPERQACHLSQLRRHPFRKFRMRVDSGANGRAANHQFAQRGGGLVQPLQRMSHLAGVARKLLAQPDRHGVLKVGSPNLDDRIKRRGFGIKRLVQVHKCRLQAGMQSVGRSHVNGRGNDVVRRLAHVHVVIGMDWALAAPPLTKNFIGPARHHLIGVHVA